jgi:antirestriction protein
MTQERATLGATPRIYVASLSDHAMGRSHGRWIDANQGAEEIRADIAAMLAESKMQPAKEWAIHDSENFGGLRLDKNESVETVAKFASLLVLHGQRFASLVEHFGGLANLDEAMRCVESQYRGAYHRPDDYAIEFLEDRYGELFKNLPDLILGNIDYEAVARDLEINGDIVAVEYDGELHVFSNTFKRMARQTWPMFLALVAKDLRQAARRFRRRVRRFSFVRFLPRKSCQKRP